MNENAAKAHRLIGHPNGHTLISADTLLPKEKLRALADDHQRVIRLREAYRNQVIPDVFKKDARNPYPAAPKVN